MPDSDPPKFVKPPKPPKPRGKRRKGGGRLRTPDGPRLDAITELRRANAIELERAIARGLRANLRTLRETLESDKSRMYDVVVAKIILEAWEQSDPRRLLLLVQRHKDLVQGPTVAKVKPETPRAAALTAAKPAPPPAAEPEPTPVADDMTLDELDAMLEQSPAAFKAATEI